MTTNGRNGAGPKDPVARGLGVFSFALGLPQIAAPGRMNRMIGVRDDARSRMWMRAVGVRELAAGVGIFSERMPKEWAWARVAGDTMDLALLVSALRGRSREPIRTVAATGAVIGAFAADVYDGLRLARESGSHDMEDTKMHVKAAVTVRRDRDELYALWRDMESYPRFMSHVEKVETTADGRSTWTARGPLGTMRSWDVVIAEDIPSERISWRAPGGSKFDARGSVRFVPAPGDQGTEVHFELRYDIPKAVGTLVALLVGENPQVQIRNDLRRFKQLAETGEIARSDGSPEGLLTPRLVKQRPAHPLADGELATAGTGGTTS